MFAIICKFFEKFSISVNLAGTRATLCPNVILDPLCSYKLFKCFKGYCCEDWGKSAEGQILEEDSVGILLHLYVGL